MKVLITRPEPDASAFAEACQAAGLEPIIAPLIDIQFLNDPPDLQGVGALAFTSANGVRAFAGLCEARHWPVFAVGPATEFAAREAGFENVLSADGDAESLAGLIAEKSAAFSGGVLHIAGTHRAGDLIAMLERRSVAARRAVLYEAKAASALPVAMTEFLNADIAGWVSLFSPRTADLFMQLVQEAGLELRLASMKAACLSDAVAAKLSEQDWAEIAVSKDRTGESLIELMTGRT